MGFNTPFQPENTGAPVFDFGFYKIQRHTKAIITEMITNFLSSRIKLYELTMPDIISIQNTDELTKIHVTPEFPYEQRKLPLIVISIGSMKEKKMYMGADNLIGYKLIGTSTGVTYSTGLATVEVYGGAVELVLNITIATLSVEERMKLVELLNICFTHFYRWQYYYTYGDGNLFNIVPNTGTVSFGEEAETKEESKTSMIYAVNMTMNSFVEYTFTSQDLLGKINTYEIDHLSGPIEY